MAKCRRWKTCKKKNTINGMCVIKESYFLQPYPCFLRPIITPKPPKKKKDRVVQFMWLRMKIKTPVNGSILRF